MLLRMSCSTVETWISVAHSRASHRNVTRPIRTGDAVGDEAVEFGGPAASCGVGADGVIVRRSRAAGSARRSGGLGPETQRRCRGTGRRTASRSCRAGRTGCRARSPRSRTGATWSSAMRTSSAARGRRSSRRTPAAARAGTRRPRVADQHRVEAVVEQPADGVAGAEPVRGGQGERRQHRQMDRQVVAERCEVLVESGQQRGPGELGRHAVVLTETVALCARRAREQGA